MRPTADQHPSHTDLAAFALGKLNRSAVDWVGSHLAECSTCREMVEQTPNDSLVKLLKGAAAGRAPKGADTGPWASGVDTGGAFPPPAAVINPDDVPAALRDHPRYRILRKLGEGGMGVVYQAEHKMMGRLVAVKVMNRGFVGHPEAIDRFTREIKAVATLNHPNIAQAYDADHADDLQLLVMEFVEGQDLAAYSKAKGPLPIAHACYYIRQAALGLQHAHEHGLVHRDLKPQNLMRMPKGGVKILDFGLAKLLTEPSAGHGLTRDKTTMGTPAYIAPEQALDTKSADIRADIYSLGCTLFCLLTGRPPFVGDNGTELVIAHLQNAPPALESLRPDAPAELSALVARMLAKKPEDRPQTPKEVVDALAPFVKAGAKAGPAPIVQVAGSGSRSRGNHLVAIAGGLFAVLVILAGIIITIKWKKDPDGNGGQVDVVMKSTDQPGGGEQPKSAKSESVETPHPGGKVATAATLPVKSEWAGVGIVQANGGRVPLVAALTVTERRGTTFRALVRISAVNAATATKLEIEGTVTETGTIVHKVARALAAPNLQDNVSGSGKAGQSLMTIVFNNPDSGGTRSFTLKRLQDTGAEFHVDGRWKCIYSKANPFERSVNTDRTWINTTNNNHGTWNQDGGLIEVVLPSGAHEWFVVDPENPNELNGVGVKGSAKWLRQ